MPIHHGREASIGALVQTSLTGSNCILRGLWQKYEFHSLSTFILLKWTWALVGILMQAIGFARN